MDGDEAADLSDLPWHTKTTGGSPSPLPSSNHSLSLIVPMRSERSGRDTPASVDSIPLEWDHDYDLSRDLETAVSQVLHSDEEDDEQVKNYFSQGATGLSGNIFGFFLSVFLYYNIFYIIIIYTTTFEVNLQFIQTFLI